MREKERVSERERVRVRVGVYARERQIETGGREEERGRKIKTLAVCH